MINSDIIEEKYAEAVTGMKEEWLNTINTQWYNYVVGLPIHLQITYLVVNLNIQIFNGGFHQYFVNGYGQFAKETIDALKIIGAFKKAELLNNAYKIVNNKNISVELFRRELLNKEITSLFITEDLFEPLDKLDTIYYNQENENIEELLRNYLRSRST